ncbi:Choline/ethanolaminephosphotransferase [Rhizopus microsporus ATCC 52813]|uniref:Choline/ethanolaminephosphotransferase n=2 Tax=Rhizopus TaxID=4842 RepID=A0A2G4TAJ9_RHIZD|nr:Choline/ethanolaminephosphotransferase [Rhizopus microsporus ATCC 52813]PHZ17726.1 Choline/ethanolaminephosphotransferase [Rhizopus microsporus ATCC 52813]
MLLKSEFLSQKQLEALRLYKYRAIDRSFTTKYILSHYWNWCVQFFPISMAPNLITLIGLIFMIINVAIASLLAPYMGTGSEAGPRWIYFSFTAGIWLYSTFDNVDGKQARRTNSSSPLGELFDHGCDAINCSFAAILQATSLGTGHSKASVMLYGIAMLGFYLSTVEEYHTGILYLGYVNAPTEGVILSCIVFIISGIYGPDVWQAPLKISWLSIPEMPRSHALIWCIGILFLLTHAPSCFYAMYKACQEKKIPFAKTMIVQNMPIATYVICLYFWVTSPYSTILSDHHFMLFSITTGIVFGRMATKVILAHLTRSSFPKFTVLLVPLIIGALLTNVPRLIPTTPLLTAQSEYIFLWAYFLFALVAYVRWALVVINSFCQFLGIQCLRIPSQKRQ